MDMLAELAAMREHDPELVDALTTYIIFSDEPDWKLERYVSRIKGRFNVGKEQ